MQQLDRDRCGVVTHQGLPELPGRGRELLEPLRDPVFTTLYLMSVMWRLNMFLML